MLQRSLSVLVVAILVAAGALVGAVPAQAADAVVEGRVVDASGKAIPDISITFYGTGGTFHGYGFTNELGMYSIQAALGVEFKVEFEDFQRYQSRPWGTYAPAWYPNAATEADATVISVAQPGVIRLKDVVLNTEGLKEFDSVPTPVISGTPEVGRTLYAQSTGSWSPTIPASGSRQEYQWFRDGKAVTAPYWGASAYTITAEDAGHKITVGIVGYLKGYRLTTAMSLPVVPARVNYPGTAKPTISGTPKVGKSLTANPGVWAPPGGPFGYQWYRSGVKIPGAVGEYYVPTGADYTKTLSVAVTGLAAGYNPATTISAPTGPVAWGGSTYLRGVEILTATGSKIGGTLIAAPIEPTLGATLTYQWYRSGKPIKGANSGTYKIAGADGGHSIKVAVTVSASGYDSVTKYSWSESVPKGRLTTKKAVITGTAKVGHSLTAHTGAWTSGTKFKFQWYRSGKVIKGATAQKYLLTGLDAGRTIKVKVAGTKAGYASASKTSTATVKIAKGTLTSKTPTVTGTAKVGKTLTAKSGAWTPGTKLTYQWYRSGKAIKGADNRTYKLTKSDRARSIKVRVAGSKTGYKSTAKYSGTIPRIR
ncbi:MAG: hypothetical protein ACQEXN_15745 [Actinomycetota bacterium]